MQPTVRILSRLCWALPLAIACGGQGTNAGAAAAPAPAVVRPLAALAGQRVVVAPTYRMRESDPLGWTSQIPRSREYLRALDDSIAAELGRRGLESQWVFPPALVRARRANPTYAADPYALAADPLRNLAVAAGARIGDPLATQLRTMIALHDARAVLLPVELRFERESDGRGIAVLRLDLIDGRLGEVRWTGDVRSDPSATFSPALASTLAAHLADLVTVR
jgi:hypothetical protein